MPSMLFGLSYLSQKPILQSLSGMLGIVILISSLAVGIKRLHDRNKIRLVSSCCSTSFRPSLLVLGRCSIAIGRYRSRSASAALADRVRHRRLGFVELGCLRGTIGPNQYGPDPRSDAAGADALTRGSVPPDKAAA